MMDSTTKLRRIFFYGFYLHFWFWLSSLSHLCISGDVLLKKQLHSVKIWIHFSLFCKLDSGLYTIYFRKNIINLGKKLVAYIYLFILCTFWLHFSLYISGLVIGNAEGQGIFQFSSSVIYSAPLSEAGDLKFILKLHGQ